MLFFILVEKQLELVRESGEKKNEMSKKNFRMSYLTQLFLLIKLIKMLIRYTNKN